VFAMAKKSTTVQVHCDDEATWHALTRETLPPAAQPRARVLDLSAAWVLPHTHTPSLVGTPLPACTAPDAERDRGAAEHRRLAVSARTHLLQLRKRQASRPVFRKQASWAPLGHWLGCWSNQTQERRPRQGI